MRALCGFPLVTLLLAALAPTPAAAHIRLDFPIGRYSDDFLKSSPCGKGADDPRSANINTFEPGSTVTVRWNETVDHTGFFRVAFDADGNDFSDFENPANELVHVDDPSGTGGKEWAADVVLPDAECDNCTLQLIQNMGGATYYQCADLVIKAGAAPTVDDGAIPSNARGSEGGGCSQTPTATSAISFICLAAVTRRFGRKRAARSGVG